jgi:DNA-binding transcriptional ArsR family regulator
MNNAVTTSPGSADLTFEVLSPPDLPLQQAVQIFGLLADESRLRLLLLLVRRGEITVLALGQLLGLSQSATSHHLMLLRMAGLVSYQRRGKYNLYYLKSDLVRGLLQNIRL